MVLTCLHCNDEFKTREKKRKFCGQSCWRKYRKDHPEQYPCLAIRAFNPNPKGSGKTVEIVCDNCGKATRLHWSKRRGKVKFCDQICHSEYMRKHPEATAHYRGGNVTAAGYRRIGQRFEHRLVMEAHIGRSLLRREIVHHKDGDKLNNDISNLELMNNAEHSKRHFSGRVLDARNRLV